MISPPPQQPLSPLPPQLPPPPPATKFPSSSFPFKRPPISLTTEFESWRPFLSQKFSIKLLDGLAKLGLSFRSDRDGEIGDRRVKVGTKWSVEYDEDNEEAVVRGAVGFGKNVMINAHYLVSCSHRVKARGEVGVVANLADPAYKLQLVSWLHSPLSKATLIAPFAEDSLEEGEYEDRRFWFVNGKARGSVLNGVCTASYYDGNLDLRYLYKDEEITFSPSISLPLNTLHPPEERKHILHIGFKHRFGPSSKLSYCYDFDRNCWKMVYKHTIGKDCKLKVWYASRQKLSSVSLWVGNDDMKAETPPMKMNFEATLNVPQDIKASYVMLWIKKRCDI